MKRVFISIGIGLLVLTGCGGTKTISSGLENESFLEFIGKPKRIYVTVDDRTAFIAKTHKAKHFNGKTYAIKTGTHIITVYYKETVVYKQQIFVSTQETKKIVLP